MIAKFISGFISGLSDLGKKLLIAASILVIVAIFDRLLIAPTMSRIATINADIVKEESVIKEDVHFLTYKNKILKEDQLVEPYLTKNVPTEDEIITGFFKTMGIMATKANITLVKVSPPVGQQEKDYLKYSSDVECSGKLTDVITFMHLVNTSDELMKVMKFNLGSPRADSDEIKATMTIVRIIVSKQTLVKPANSSPANTHTDGSNTK